MYKAIIELKYYDFDNFTLFQFQTLKNCEFVCVIL